LTVIGPGSSASGSDRTDEVSGEAQALTALGDALDLLDAGRVRVLAEAVILLRAHPRWAIWRPAGSHEWTAVRPAGSSPPGPDMPMIWVRAGTAGELAGMMRRADSQLPPGAGG
jgi:hypothetical protein